MGEEHKDAPDSFLLKEFNTTILVRNYDQTWGSRMATWLVGSDAWVGFEQGCDSLGMSVAAGNGEEPGAW